MISGVDLSNSTSNLGFAVSVTMKNRRAEFVSRPNSYPGQIESRSFVSRPSPCLEFVSRLSSCLVLVRVSISCPGRVCVSATLVSRLSSCPGLVRVSSPCPIRACVPSEAKFVTFNDAQIPTYRYDLNITDD